MFNVKNQSNYLAKIVAINKLVPIQGADKIQSTIIDYNNIIVGKDTNLGDVVVYFPVECQINSELLSYLNLYSNSDLNKDTTQKGFFGTQGRVKCVSMLKGTVKSEGFCIPLLSLKEFIVDKFGNFPADKNVLGISFDYYNDFQICKKYELDSFQDVKTKKEKSTNKLKFILVDKQFKFHGDTSHLKQNIFKFNLDDIVVITNKVHGTSFIGAHVKINKNLTWFQKIGIKVGLNRDTTEWGYVWSSGKPKNNLPKGVSSKTNKWATNTKYYTYDVWQANWSKISNIIPKGYSIYGEIIGQNIQGPYTYGIIGNKLLVYKITVTNEDGVTHTLDWNSVKDFCKKYKLEHVQELYVGPLNKFGSTYDDVIENLSKQYLEKDTVCGNPDEGITIQSYANKEWYKLKSFRFLKKESETLDQEKNGIES